MKRRIFVTGDGSHSISDEDRQVTYHSKYGAIQESKHVFIESGIKKLAEEKSTIDIFEMGFGTGLNALLTLLQTEICHQAIYYETIELFPLQKIYYERLNYCRMLNREDLERKFQNLHQCAWDEEVIIGPYFRFKKVNKSLLDHIFNKPFDIIFYDAFAPLAQPELWTKEIFEKLFVALLPGAALTTYCSKAEVQRNMKAAGFIIEKLPGPLHKREILRAVKK
jgi:tRNA U34 5-methylaminomethyl-2-thiouridine-forming methyltransferase MnmC